MAFVFALFIIWGFLFWGNWPLILMRWINQDHLALTLGRIFEKHHFRNSVLLTLKQRATHTRYTYTRTVFALWSGTLWAAEGSSSSPSSINLMPYVCLLSLHEDCWSMKYSLGNVYEDSTMKLLFRSLLCSLIQNFILNLRSHFILNVLSKISHSHESFHFC